jgi:PDZ domain-containing protein
MIPRGDPGSALAVLRHPVSSSAAIARPAMHAALTVTPATESATVTDTQSPTLPGDPEAGGAATPLKVETEREAAARVGLVVRSGRHRFWTVPVVGIALVVLVAVVVAASTPSGWFAEKQNRRLGVDQPASYARTPASAQPVDDLISISDLGDAATQYPPSGEILFVTVMHPSQSLLSWLVARDNPAIQFLNREDVYGFSTPSQRRTLDLASMRTSEQVAQYVALKRLGFDVSIDPGEVLIESFVCLQPNADNTACATWSPSEAVLDPGDRIIKVDGETIATTDDLTKVLTGKQPGDVVTITVVRPDEGELEVEVELTASPDDASRTIIGFFPFDTATVDLPFELSIDPGSVGGPSAGLAFTLTLIDELSPGELTGGKHVAVTGTIGLDGSVGPIGGLRQKASAVAQAGVDVFIVPAAQGEDDIAAAQRSGGPGLTIIPVETLEDALAALASVGGAEIPAAPVPSTTAP